MLTMGKEDVVRVRWIALLVLDLVVAFDIAFVESPVVLVLEWKKQFKLGCLYFFTILSFETVCVCTTASSLISLSLLVLVLSMF